MDIGLDKPATWIKYFILILLFFKKNTIDFKFKMLNSFLETKILSLEFKFFFKNLQNLLDLPVTKIFFFNTLIVIIIFIYDFFYNCSQIK